MIAGIGHLSVNTCISYNGHPLSIYDCIRLYAGVIKFLFARQ